MAQHQALICPTKITVSATMVQVSLSTVLLRSCVLLMSPHYLVFARMFSSNVHHLTSDSRIMRDNTVMLLLLCHNRASVTSNQPPPHFLQLRLSPDKKSLDPRCATPAGSLPEQTQPWHRPCGHKKDQSLSSLSVTPRPQSPLHPFLSLNPLPCSFSHFIGLLWGAILNICPRSYF